MANPKKGLSYYNIDTDRYQDIRIKRLKKIFSCQGIAVYDYILCEIYRVKGCFLEWDDSTAFDVAEYFGLKETLVQEIVKYCASVGLFNKELLRSGIVTSLAIQKRYLDACKRAKRQPPVIPPAIQLTEEANILPEQSAIITEETPHSSGSLPQRKIEESIVESSSSIISPSLNRSEEGGGRVNIVSLLLKESISREDILEAARLTNDGTPGYATDYIVAWVTNPAAKSRYHISQVLEALQKLEEQGRITCPTHEQYTVTRWLRNNLTSPDSENILSLLTTHKHYADCLLLIEDIKKGRINCPAQFLLKKLNLK